MSLKHQRLFVYGDLRKGKPGHSRLGNARFMGNVKTMPGYYVSPIGEDKLPMLTFYGGPSSVDGELYELLPGQLEKIDRYEDKRYTRSYVALSDWTSAHAYVMP